jgi:hypothetical protein
MHHEQSNLAARRAPGRPIGAGCRRRPRAGWSPPARSTGLWSATGLPVVGAQSMAGGGLGPGLKPSRHRQQRAVGQQIVGHADASSPMGGSAGLIPHDARDMVVAGQDPAGTASNPVGRGQRPHLLVQWVWVRRTTTRREARIASRYVHFRRYRERQSVCWGPAGREGRTLRFAHESVASHPWTSSRSSALRSSVTSDALTRGRPRSLRPGSTPAVRRSGKTRGS